MSSGRSTRFLTEPLQQNPPDVLLFGICLLSCSEVCVAIPEFVHRPSSCFPSVFFPSTAARSSRWDFNESGMNLVVLKLYILEENVTQNKPLISDRADCSVLCPPAWVWMADPVMQCSPERCQSLLDDPACPVSVTAFWVLHASLLAQVHFFFQEKIVHHWPKKNL